jgi:hypothetical protein
MLRTQTGRCRDAPCLLIRRGSPCGTCGGVEGVRKVQGSPASRNCMADRELTGLDHARFWQLQGMGIGIEASGWVLVLRRSYCATRGRLRYGGEARPQRRGA